MRRLARRIGAQDFGRLRKQRLLIARDDSQLNKTIERPTIFAICLLGMSPRIESRRRLGQPDKKNCFAQCEISRRFVEISSSGGFRPDSPIAITAAIQIRSENSFLAESVFKLSRDNRFVQFPAPT